MIENQSDEHGQPRIRFGIENNRLTAILRYAYEINGNILFQCFKDKILMQLSDSSTTEFREYPQQFMMLSANSDKLLDYDPGIEDDNGVKIFGIKLEGFLDKINALLEKDSITRIKIDLIKGKADFYLGSVKKSADVFQVSESEINVLNAVHANIERMRSDSKIESASARIELLSLERISKFNGQTNVRDVKNRILMTLDKKGLHVINFDKKAVVELEAKEDNNSDSDIPDFQTAEDVEKARLRLENYIRECNSEEPLTELLSDLKVNIPQSVLVEIDHIKHFALLNDIDHRKILIEIRQDMSLILQKVGSEENEREFLNDALLVIAPITKSFCDYDKSY